MLRSLVESGELADGDTSTLEDMCEDMHISEAAAQGMLGEIVQKKAAGGVLQASALHQQGRQGEMVEELEAMLRYTALMP